VKAYQVRLLPTLYLIDQQQRAYKAWTGSIEGRETEVIENIKALLESSAHSSQE
jgi:hypothetical protein